MKTSAQCHVAISSVKSESKSGLVVANQAVADKVNVLIQASVSFRCPEIFAYVEGVEVMQEDLNELIEGGVQKITTLVRNTEMAQTMDIESGTMYLHF